MCFFDADDLSHARGHLSRLSIYVSVYLSQYFPGGVILVAASPEEIPAAVQRLKPLLGYRFLGIHRGDLFIASRATVQTNDGLLDETGSNVKAPDGKLPGRWVRAPTLSHQPGT